MPEKKSSLGIDLTEFKAGWRVLLLSIIGVTTSAGVIPIYGFGSMVVPLEQAFGWTRGDLQPAITFFFVGMVVASLIAGATLQRFGLRKVALVSLLIVPLVFLLLTQITQVWMLYVLYFLTPIAGIGVLQITWTQLTNLWFEENRGLALACVLSGTGIAASILPIVVAFSIDKWGSWQAGYWACSVMIILVALPVCYFLFPKDQTSDLEQKQQVVRPVSTQGLSFKQASRSYRFWAQCLGLSCVVIGILAMMTNLVPLMRDSGLSAAKASSIFGVTGLSLIVGRISAGYLVDRLWAPAVAFVMLALPALGCFLLLNVGADVRMLMISCVLIGVGAGAEYDIASYLVAKYFCMQEYSRIFSLSFGVTSAAVCASPLVFGAIYDSTGSYQQILWICIVLFLIGSSLMLTLGAYPDFDRCEND